MDIAKFADNRGNMEKQYARFYQGADAGKANDLYKQMQTIYYGERAKAIGFGKAVKHYFANVELYVNPSDIFADIANEAGSSVSLRDEEYRKYVRPDESSVIQSEGAILADCDFGHTMPDWNTVFGKGITGILASAKMCLKKANLSEEQKNFYLSVQYAYEGVMIYMERLREACEQNDSPNARFAAQNLAALLRGTPTTLAEAMQLYFIYYAVQYLTQGNSLRSLGAVDDILYPYYVHDLECGICSEEDVRELIRYFLFKWNSREILANMPFNLCTHTNALTYLILEEYIALNVPDPKIHIKCSENTPDKVYQIIMQSIRRGNNSFVFTNDAVIQKALVKIGIAPEDAEDYTLIGCYEPSACGKEIPCTLNGRINMPMAVETVLNGGKRFSSEQTIGMRFEETFSCFDDFYNAVKMQLKAWSEITISAVNRIEKQYPNVVQAPILSATYESCMQKGKDAYAGGAKYNNSSVCIFGIATVADALAAIKKAVYEDKIITLSELKTVLKRNWQGAEKLRKMMQDNYPKFGNNNDEADALAKDLVQYMASCINGKENGRGGVYRMGMFSIDWIIDYGKKLGASADGRFAGEAVSKNLSASIGMDKNGVTGLIHSATKFDFTDTPNGAVLDLQLHPTAVTGEEGIAVMISLLKIYLKKGGLAVHFNVIDPDMLKAAQKEPEKYKNLQVRLCGWNVYFTDLEPEMQNNLILSMEGKG